MSIGMFFSQEKKDSPCHLRTENEKWKLNFEKADSKSERIELIKQKLISDSIYIETKPIIKTAHGPINRHQDKYGNDCGCKITFLLIPKGKGGFYNLNLNSNPDILGVLDSFDKENIYQIHYILKNDHPPILPSSPCGIVKMTTWDEELIKRIENVW